jgi:hypothetical protein
MVRWAKKIKFYFNFIEFLSCECCDQQGKALPPSNMRPDIDRDWYRKNLHSEMRRLGAHFQDPRIVTYSAKLRKQMWIRKSVIECLSPTAPRTDDITILPAPQRIVMLSYYLTKGIFYDNAFIHVIYRTWCFIETVGSCVVPNTELVSTEGVEMMWNLEITPGPGSMRLTDDQQELLRRFGWRSII